MIKEELQAQLEILVKLRSAYNNLELDTNIINKRIIALNKQSENLKSIEDIKIEEYQRGFTDAMEQYKPVMLDNMEKAFEAGGDLMDDRGLDVVYQYKTFEEYLKRNETK